MAVWILFKRKLQFGKISRRVNNRKKKADNSVEEEGSISVHITQYKSIFARTIEAVFL